MVERCMVWLDGNEYQLVHRIAVGLTLKVDARRLQEALAQELANKGYYLGRRVTVSDVRRGAAIMRPYTYRAEITYPADTCEGKALTPALVVETVAEIELQIREALRQRSRLQILVEDEDLPF